MRLPRAAGQRAGEPLLSDGWLLAVLFFWFVLAGCNGTCVRFQSNSTTGTISFSVNDTKSSCALDPATNGTVHVTMVSAASPAAAGPSGIRHIFLTLRGIEAQPAAASQPDALPDGDSAPWQELAPQLARQPVQLDLAAEPARSWGPSLFGEATAPAGPYRRIRLVLLSGEAAPAPAGDACGGILHCIVTADGRILPLALDRASAALPIASEDLPGGSFFVLPGAVTKLVLRFDPDRSSAVAASEGLRFFPAFTLQVAR
jgi:hypothetical protein